MLSVSMAASLTAPKVTWMCPSPLISASQLARDRGETLLPGFFGRLVVAVDLDQGFANGAQGGVGLGRVLVPALLEDLEAGRRGALPGPHQGIQPGLQAAELGLDLGVDVEDVLGGCLHGRQLGTEVRTGSAHPLCSLQPTRIWTMRAVKRSLHARPCWTNLNRNRRSCLVAAR